MVPLSQTVFASFVFIPTVLVVIVTTAIFIWTHPEQDGEIPFNQADAAPAGTAEANTHARSRTCRRLPYKLNGRWSVR
ncbi:hypothetical protein [Paraburkholderia dipogonis]|uniref:hypothetical protein n=1 Tax=Paraburkholderia dipogonis TaxID=1211383 RepID=UPI0038B714EF